MLLKEQLTFIPFKDRTTNMQRYLNLEDCRNIFNIVVYTSYTTVTNPIKQMCDLR